MTELDLPPKNHNIALERLRSIIERIEKIEQEKKDLSSDIKDIMVEASSAGFDKKVIREVIRLRKMSQEDLEERDALLDLYMGAVS